MNAMALTLLTPIRTLHFEDGDLVVLMTKQGSEGFLYNHVPTLVEVVPGALRYRVPDPFGGEGTWRVFFVSVGYAEVQCDHVTVVVNAAELPGEIDEKRAMSAQKRAEDRLKKPDLTELEQEHAEHGVRRAKARLAFHRRYCPNETAQ
jgi:F-type H+-transporting ATPase subunit epsilon